MLFTDSLNSACQKKKKDNKQNRNKISQILSIQLDNNYNKQDSDILLIVMSCLCPPNPHVETVSHDIMILEGRTF